MKIIQTIEKICELSPQKSQHITVSEFGDEFQKIESNSFKEISIRYVQYR